MIYQPVLDSSTLKNEGLRYHIRYRNSYTEPDDPQLDESHIHSCYEIYFNLSGDVSFWVNNRLYPIKSGDMIVTRPGDVHLCVYHSACVHEHFCLWLELPEGSPAYEYMKGFFSGNYYSFGEEKSRPAKLLSSLKRQSKNGEVFLQTATFFELLAFLGERWSDHSAPIPELLPQEMQKIIDDLNENFAAFHNVCDIVEKYYVSQATLNRWFRKYLHISPREFLEAKKLSYSKKLLSEGSSVTEACMLSGFSDCSHYIAVFKKKFGETPFRYKKQAVHPL